MVELSVIIQEHNEGKEFIDKMISQVLDISIDHETIFVTSMNANEFIQKYGPFDSKTRVIGDVQSCGAARNAGATAAIGRSLLFMDCHVCFENDDLLTLMNTLNVHPGALVGPSITPVEFPECTTEGGSAHGVAFYFDEVPFEWKWLHAPTLEKEFEAPFICGCAFVMRKTTFNVLSEYGGFLDRHIGLSWEEEKSMRLWRLGHATYVEPRAQFGHLFKGYGDHPKWDEHSTLGYHMSRVIGAYINVFDEELWDHIEKLCIKEWGKEIWEYHLNLARAEFSWLRNKMAPFKDKIDEDWFLRRSTA